MSRRMHCDQCGDLIEHPANAYRIHDPRGFGDDWDLCSTDCLVKRAEQVAEPIEQAAASNWGER